MYHLRNLFGYRQVASLPSNIGERRVGTIGYSWAGLVCTISILALGAFSFVTIQNLFNTLMPLQLSSIGASNKTIALIVTTMPYYVALVINPLFSSWSDRLRTRFGRRNPFILLSAPFITICLIGLGWAPEIATYLNNNSFIVSDKLTFWLLIIFAILYQIVFMIPGAIFWYLFPDVIPKFFMSRFMALFQIISSGAWFVFARWMLPFSETAIGYLYTFIGILYLVSMVILFFTVREGEYSEVDDIKGNVGVINAIKVYFKECYSIGFYYPFFLAVTLSEVSTICRGMYNLLYAKNNLHISIEDFGKIMSYYALVGLICSLPFGWLSDRFHPMKVYGGGLLLVVIVNVLSFYFVDDRTTFMYSTIMLGVVYAVQTVSTIPMFVAILPEKLYGQFCSACSLFRALFIGILGLGGGALLDYLGNYQYIYAWDAVFTFIALLCFIKLHSNWQKRGGKASYIAPVGRN